MYNKYIKRLLDIIGALIILPFFCILFIFIAPCIYLEDHGTVFYKAERRGVNAKNFYIYKFRSMHMNAPDIRNKDNSTYNAADDPRVTKVGKFLRKTSLDETAQIINVLKGDMSFIGPRPVTTILPIEQFDQKRWDRLKVRPGISGYSQAYYRNSIDQETKFEYDAYYANNISFALDVKILLKTIGTVLHRSNVYNSDSINSSENKQV